MNSIGSALDGPKFDQRHKSSRNRGLSLVESYESRLLIGREHSQKIFKGGTLTILNCCQLMVIEANWLSLGMIDDQVYALIPLSFLPIHCQSVWIEILINLNNQTGSLRGRQRDQVYALNPLSFLPIHCQSVWIEI